MKKRRAGPCGKNLKTKGRWYEAVAEANRPGKRHSLTLVATSVSEWRFVGSLALAATPRESWPDQISRGLLWGYLYSDGGGRVVGWGRAVAGGDPFAEAAGAGDTDRVSVLLDESPDIVSERGVRPGHTGLRTALHHATSGRHLDTTALLLERGADPNVRDEGDNALPIHFAAENGDLSLIKLLVEHGSDTIGDGDDHELEVIGWATCFSNVHRDVAEFLLAHGARQTIFSATALGDVTALRAIANERREDLDRTMDKTNMVVGRCISRFSSVRSIR